jgi:chemotaxis protein CheX
MKTAFPIACYRAGIADATVAVFQTMLGLAVEQRDAAPDRPVTEFTAAVYYAGEWQGALLIECSAEQAVDWTARQFGLPTDAGLADDVRDALGELTNVLAGNLKPLLPKGVGLSMPSVVEGTDYGLHLCGGNLFERVDFTDEHGPFRVTFVEVLERQ